MENLSPEKYREERQRLAEESTNPDLHPWQKVVTNTFKWRKWGRTAYRARAANAAWDKQGRKISGSQFGGLKPIFVDPTLDPAPGLCFRCWQSGHGQRQCLSGFCARFCFNCGHRERDHNSCERCQEAHVNFLRDSAITSRRPSERSMGRSSERSARPRPSEYPANTRSSERSAKTRHSEYPVNTRFSEPVRSQEQRAFEPMQVESGEELNLGSQFTRPTIEEPMQMDPPSTASAPAHTSIPLPVTARVNKP